MRDKTEQILAYITKDYPGASITSLMKLCYFIDLVSMKESNTQLTDFKYKGRHYGPFDSKIYNKIDNLINNRIVMPNTGYTTNDEYIIYFFNDKTEEILFNLSEKECKLIDEVLAQLRGYGAKALSDIAYKTKPMLAINAIQGGESHLNKPLDLTQS